MPKAGAVQFLCIQTFCNQASVFQAMDTILPGQLKCLAKNSKPSSQITWMQAKSSCNLLKSLQHRRDLLGAAFSLLQLSHCYCSSTRKIQIAMRLQSRLGAEETLPTAIKEKQTRWPRRTVSPLHHKITAHLSCPNQIALVAFPGFPCSLSLSSPKGSD
eukprot:scaffold235366_cov15-Tisochrysis_lutea.AAC.1